jgi:processed acidic surface protein
MKKLGGLLLAIMLLIGFIQPVMASETASTELDLTAYLTEVSAIRGFEVSQEDIELSLSMFGEKLTNFETVDEVKTFLGDVIVVDLSNLEAIYTKFNLDQAGLELKLLEYGEALDDYIFLDDLDAALSFYMEYETPESETTEPEIDLSMYMDLLSQIGLTPKELTKLGTYLAPVFDYMSSPEGQAENADLVSRLTQFGKLLYNKGIADETYQLSDAEYAELEGYISELLSTMQIQIKFSVIKDGVDTQYTLMEMTKLQPIKDADYKIAIYDMDSKLLADAVITSEFINSYLGEIINDLIPENAIDTDSKPIQTVKGGELPKTAGNYLANVILGMFVVIGSIIIFRKVKRNQNEML